MTNSHVIRKMACGTGMADARPRERLFRELTSGSSVLEIPYEPRQTAFNHPGASAATRAGASIKLWQALTLDTWFEKYQHMELFIYW
jgi:hypothetical protein